MRAACRACLCFGLFFGLAGAPAAANDAEEIKDTVFDCNRAGYERGDLAAFMKLWADDAKIIDCREEKSGKYDHAVNRKQLEAMQRLSFSALPDGGYKLAFESPRVEVTGDKAELRVMTVLTWGEAGRNLEKQSEIYLLRRTAGGWRVYENRAWPIESKDGEKSTDFDAKGWEALDAKVKAAEKDGEADKLAEALYDARRFVEAHQAAKKATAEGAKAEAWLRRGYLAIAAGDTDDATKAFREAIKLDPDASVPGVIGGAKKDPPPKKAEGRFQ